MSTVFVQICLKASDEEYDYEARGCTHLKGFIRAEMGFFFLRYLPWRHPFSTPEADWHLPPP